MASKPVHAKNMLKHPVLLIPAFCILLTSTLASAANDNWPHGIDDDTADMTDRANMPDDPGYYNERLEGETVVDVGGAWNLWSFVPEAWQNLGDPIRPEEIEMGTGIHADRAWLLSHGRRDVIIAVLDSGVYWDNDDLRYKYYLHPGELDRDGARPCVPAEFAGDPLDVNDDGVFNIADYEAHHGECDWDIDTEGNNNGRLDPQDLIGSSRYADGVDDDGNGFIDDISGWDFFWNDNDAYDDTRFGHGNGEAQDSAAEGNNGRGGIGVCPECTVMMLRVGDSFVADVNDFGGAVSYAVDNGASVIQEALGTINLTSFARQSIEYAYENNVVTIASAADELSFHHNFPGTTNHTVYVHAVVHDSPNRNRSTTFLNFNNCTNFGGQLVLSTPGGGCSSEATGKSSGHAGLIYSYALDQEVDPPLSAEEVRGLMIMSADDIDVPESQDDHEDNDGSKYPSAEGWDWHFGYGRNNARTSLELIRDDRIPPEVDVVWPLWFEIVYVDDDNPTFDVTGRIGSRMDGEDPRYESYDYQLAVAEGVQPGEDTFEEVATGTTAGIDGVLGTIDTSEFRTAGVPADPHDFSLTIRLRACVTDSGDFGDGGVCSEFRKTIFAHEDPDLHAGFPVRLNGSGEPSGTFYDLDNDGADELILPDSDGTLHVFDSEGGEMDGFPVLLDTRDGHTDLAPNPHGEACAFRPRDDRGDCPTRGHVDYDVRHTALVGAPAVGDLEGDDDEDVEIVMSTADGWVYAFHHDGTRVEGFPVRTDPANSEGTDPNNWYDEGILAGVTIYDLDGNDDLEIIVGAGDQHVYAWDHDGEDHAGFPVHCRDTARDADEDLSPSAGNRIVATPAVGDLDGDGDPEIVIGTNEVYDTVESRFYIIHHDGNDHDGGPFAHTDIDEDDPGPGRNFSLLGEVLPVVGRGIPTAAILADVNFDGLTEFTVEGIGGQPVMRQWDGEAVWDLKFMNISTEAFGPLSDVDDDFSYTLVNHGAFGYLDDSGDLAYLKGAAGIDFGLAFAEGGLREEFDHQLAGWNVRTGAPLEGFPRVMEDWQFFMTPAIVDLNDDGYPEVINGSGGYLLRAFNYRGEELEGWPKQTGGWIVSSPAVGDFDGDGFYDVAVANRLGWAFIWKTEGSVDGFMEWNGFGHDVQNTFNYETGFPDRERREPPADPDPEPSDDLGNDTLEPDDDPDMGPDVEVGENDAEEDAEEDTASGGGGTGDADGDDGCGCTARNGGNTIPAEWLLFIGIALWFRRRR